MTIATARQFVGRQWPVAMMLATGLTMNRPEAEDLAQEALRRALANWRRLDSGRPQGPWLRTVMRNSLLDGRKRVERARGVSLDAPIRENGSTLAEFLPDGQASPLELLLHREKVETVRQVLSRLSAKHREALRACDMERMRYRQAARMLGIPLGTLRSRLHRAREVFRWRYTGFKDKGLPAHVRG